ncbi:zinc transporter ZntB [Pelagerythrobacter rhizovicinus]|uniref:Zinc transporter ZntB n=2 Tax=Pelagerythrobacter rhizovicinus TaxID=2268576 RepID=A0A4Q2KIM5_9SPHN|nr:zinc transporter ZntB [Pelagerythrobacter rhizovicinus]
MEDPADPTDENEDETALLFGRVLDGRGGARAIDWAEAQGWRPAAAGQVMWLHVRRTHAGVCDWLQAELGIPEPTARLLVSDATRPRAFREGETLVAVLRGINFNPGAAPEDMVSMHLWSDGTRLVTLRRAPLQTPQDTLLEFEAGTGPADAGSLVTSLTGHMVQRMNAAIVDMNDEIDRLEDLDMEEEGNEEVLSKAVAIRRNCLALQRHMGPQHVALEAIAREAPEWFEGHDRREIAETIALLRRFLDDVDISKESAVVLMDELRARSLAGAERTNYLLTIVAAIFLPLTFLTGLLGINVGGMPGADDEAAFWIVVALCAGIMATQLALFRKWKWL